MSVAQVEAANHFPNERPSRPKNGPPTAGDDGSSDRVHHHHHSNGATIADNNGRSASRYDTNATTPLDGYSSYQKPKHQYPTSIESSEIPMRATRTQTNASAAAASNPNPNPTSSNNPSNQPPSAVKNPSPITTLHHDAATGDATPSAARVSVVTTPVSPPPSPPLLSGLPASGPAVKLPPSAPAILPASSSSSRGTTPRPTAPGAGGSASPKEPSPIPSNSSAGGSGVANAAVTTPARGGSSLASLLHSDHRDVTDSDSRRDIMQGTTPPSPDSLPQVGHSRNPSMAESNSTTLRESPSKENKDDDEEEDEDEEDEAMMMDVDHSNPPTHSIDSASRNTSETTTTAPTAASFSRPTHHPARHLASRSPQPQPTQPPHSHSHSSSSSAGVLAPSQPRSQPSPSATSVAQQPYPHPSHVSTQIPRHQPMNTNTSSSTTNNNNHHASSRSQSDRHPLPSSAPAAGYAHATQTPTSESSPPNARPFHAGVTDERDRQIDALARDREELRRTVNSLKMTEERYIQQIQEFRRREEEYIANESNRAAWLNAVGEWVREGQRLLNEGRAPVMPNGYGPSSAASQGGRPGGLLSSAMVGSSSRDYERSLERDRTQSVVSPYSPVAHNRSYSHTQEHQRYPSQSSAAPNHFDPSGRRGANSARPAVPPQPNLRRARRPSSDDLSAQAGVKRIKTDSGDYIRVSPDAYARDHPDSRPLPPSGVSTPIDPRRAPAYGREGTANSGTVAPSDKRGSGSLGSGTERGRDSPSDRRTTGREDDEEFPSPRRQYATPTTATGPSMAGNGRVSRGPSSLETVAALATAGEDADADADGSPDPTVAAGLGAHKELMELAEDDPEALSGKGSLRRPRPDGLRNGSRSSMNSQDLDEMLAEAVGDEDPSIARYGTDTSMRSTTKQRHRAASNTLTRNPGGSISTFPLQFGSHPDHAQSRAYPASSQPKYGSGLPSGNSRGYVFRNMDPAEMEAQSQARSPEESLHRQSFSGSLPAGNAGSPPIPNPGPMTMQFLPPQSGPPMPKKIYHHKGTGQVIGSQHAGMAPTLGGSVDPNSAAARGGAPPSGFMTIDGQMKRTCKQCGQPGRYKDNKCVEKWGPGPQGPGTVCDRCRKKMKRVEKRATQDSAMMTAAVNHHHQYPIAPAPPVSYSQLPVQGSQRFDESQESGYSQPTDDGRPSLSRAGSQNYSSMHQSQLTRRGSYVSDSAMRREPSHSYPSSMNPPRESMPPPSSFTNTHSSPESGRGEARSSVSTTGLAPDSRDGEVDADGDAEMDELMEEELGAAADAATNASHRNRVKGESP